MPGRMGQAPKTSVVSEQVPTLLPLQTTTDVLPVQAQHWSVVQEDPQRYSVKSSAIQMEPIPQPTGRLMSQV